MVEAPDEDLDLVVPERLGDVVAPAKVKFGKTAMVVPVTMPTVPGRYRLSITLHDADGVAYDAATQALVPPLIVRVTGDFDGAILAAPTAELVAGTKADLELRVVNLGRTAWGHLAIATPTNPVAKAQPAMVIGRWIPLSAGAVLPTDPAVRTPLPIGLAPRTRSTRRWPDRPDGRRSVPADARRRVRRSAARSSRRAPSPPWSASRSSRHRPTSFGRAADTARGGPFGWPYRA